MTALRIDPKERFIEDRPESLRWRSEPVTKEEQKRAKEIFHWISKH